MTKIFYTNLDVSFVLLSINICAYYKKTFNNPHFHIIRRQNTLTNLTQKKRKRKSISAIREKTNSVLKTKKPIKPLNMESIFENSWMSPLEDKKQSSSMKLLTYKEIDYIKNIRNFAPKKQYIKRTSSQIQCSFFKL